MISDRFSTDKRFSSTLVRSTVIGLMALGVAAAGATAGSAGATTAAAAPTSITAAASQVRNPPQTIERRGEQYEVVNRAGSMTKGSVSVQYGVEWVHADVPCCLEPIPGDARVRGYALIGKNTLVRAVKVDAMVLGSEQRALTHSGGSGSSVPGQNLATAETPWSTDASRSDHAYRVRVTFSVRWNDGTLSRFTRTSPLTSAGQ